MLSSIKMKGIASFDNDLGMILNDLKKINFIYGANGCGKTTISNFLANTSRSEFLNCEAIWEHSIPLNIYAYNKKFRDDNFGTGKIAGVFTLGKATKEEMEEIEKKKQELAMLKDSMTGHFTTKQHQEQQLEQLNNDFTDERWENSYKKYKNYFKEAFQGFIGSKKAFAEKLILVYKTGFDAVSLPTLEELKKKAETIFGEIPEQLSLIHPPTDFKLSPQKDLQKDQKLNNNTPDKEENRVKSAQKYLSEASVISNQPNLTHIEFLESSEIWKTVIIGKKGM
ncbi:MAG: AAA family ATPase [Proteobacteria bacterium]|nr:AAA family ATPase [Pseudomonadota bacterium]